MTNSQYSVHFFDDFRRSKIGFHYVIHNSQAFPFIQVFFLPQIGQYDNNLAGFGIRLSFLIAPSNSNPSIPGITTSKQNNLRLSSFF